MCELRGNKREQAWPGMRINDVRSRNYMFGHSIKT